MIRILAPIGGVLAVLVLVGGYAATRWLLKPHIKVEDSAATTQPKLAASADSPQPGPARSPATPAATADEDQVRDHLREVGLAMHDFNNTWKSLPGADRQRDDGPRGLSWRVHILPHLGQKPLYDQFKLDEPWDTAHNRRLIANMPDHYKTPGVAEAGMTAMQLFVGPDTPFGGEKPPRIRDFLDGTRDTLMLVVGGPEVATEWTRPGGIPFAVGASRDLLGSPPIPRGYPMLFASVDVAILPRDISANLLQALVGHNDSRIIDHTALELFAVESREKQRREEEEQLAQKAQELARQQAAAKRPRPSDEDQLRSRLLLLWSGMNSFELTFGSFPGADRSPLHNSPGLSWRVHLLEHVEQAPLSRQFHFDEPWDSPHNKQLIGKLPDIYKSPSVTEPGKTTLHVFVGKDTPFGGAKPPRIRDFSDGTAHSLLFVFGGPETAIEWTRPGGISFAAGAGRDVLGTPTYAKGFPMAFADGSVGYLPPNIPADLLLDLVRTGDKRRIDRGALNLFDIDQRAKPARDARQQAEGRSAESMIEEQEEAAELMRKE